MYQSQPPKLNGFRDRPELLIIDKSPQDIQVLRDVLDLEYKISHALSENEVFDMVGEGKSPDLILLDLMEPSALGFEICRHLKENSGMSDIPIILMSSRCDLEDEIRGLSLGAADFILKPFHIPLVIARINNHLNLKSKADMLEHMAHIDSLTHIPNRRRFDFNLNEEWRRAIRANTYLAVLMIDLDDFKAYNDQHGHGNGDNCLREIAGCLSNMLQRPGDLIARYGGEEFVALLPGCDLNNAANLAERMRAAVESPLLQYPVSADSKPVTISIGCAAEQPSPERTPTQLLQRADQNLYRAKSNGKNQVWKDSDNRGA